MSDVSPESTMPEVSRHALIKTLASLWWVLLIRGIVLIILGAYTLFQPGMSLVAFTQVLGVFVIVDGILAIVAAVMGVTESRGWTLLRGVLGILVGITVFAHPVLFGTLAAMTLLFMIAAQAIICGVLEIVAAIRGRKEIEGEGLLILAGVLSIILGLLLLSNPFMSSIALIRLIGAFAIVFGVALITNSFRLRKLNKLIEE